jgi:hypothetical protein
VNMGGIRGTSGIPARDDPTDWTRTEIQGSEKKVVMGAWFGAAIMIAVLVWFFWHSSMPLFLAKGLLNPMVWGTGLIALAVLAKAIWETIRLKRFGNPILELNTAPILLGGTLEGRINITGIDQGPEFSVTLACIHRVVTSNGKNSNTKETILWSNEKKATLLPGGVLAISIPVPINQPQTNCANSFDSIIWRLSVKGPFRGPAFLEKYELPVRGNQSPSSSTSVDSLDLESEKEAPAPAPKATSSPVPLILLFILAFVVGLIFLYYGVVDLNKAISSENWPTATGKIVSSQVINVGRKSSNYAPEITYAYSANGKSYQSTQVYPHWFWSSKSSRNIVATFPVQDSVLIHFSPKDPTDAVLLTGLRWGVFQRLLCATLVLCVAALLASMALSTKDAVTVGNTIYFREGSFEAKVVPKILLLMVAQGLLLWYIT